MSCGVQHDPCIGKKKIFIQYDRGSEGPRVPGIDPSNHTPKIVTCEIVTAACYCLPLLVLLPSFEHSFGWFTPKHRNEDYLDQLNFLS